ncbi:MAG TPA: gliding motility protein GldM [Phnomibacter sp.]|nr:gliding motility protein GldM [Phnomibacter sp.]
MALPKEPRQKMINMMYLVLTALLALNVSSEILNAFKTVNNSLENSNVVIDNSNNGIAASMAEMLKDPNTREKASFWQPKADEALRLTRETSAYITALKDSLLAEAGLREDGTYKEDNLEAATRLFETKDKGKELLEKLTKFKDEILAILPDTLARKVEADLPIDLEIPKTQNQGNNTWSSAYFRMTPAVAAITILSKFDNDIKRSGNIVATTFMEQVGKVVLRLNKFEPLVSQNTEYTLPGQPIKITAGLGAFSTDNLPTVTINGTPRTVDPATGTATWETTAAGGGDQSVKVVVNFTDPNTGQRQTLEKVVKYTVGQPSGASIFLEKMNVMYIGVDNPVTISSGSGRAERMTVSFSGGSISPAGGGGKYVTKPTTAGPATVNVNVEGKSFAFPIRVKPLPDPVPLVGTLSGGKMPSAQFKVMGGVRAVLKDSEFDAPFQVISYTIAGNGAGFQQYTPVNITGAQWGSNAVITQCRPGSTIFIDDIIARGPDGKNRKLPSIAFQLQ